MWDVVTNESTLKPNNIIHHSNVFNFYKNSYKNNIMFVLKFDKTLTFRYCCCCVFFFSFLRNVFLVVRGGDIKRAHCHDGANPGTQRLKTLFKPRVRI